MGKSFSKDGESGINTYKGRVEDSVLTRAKRESVGKWKEYQDAVRSCL